MHNLHLVIVNAETGKEACSEVEGYIALWGDENNWREMCGALSSDGQVYNADAGRWNVADEDCDTPEKINVMVKSWIKEEITLDDKIKERILFPDTTDTKDTYGLDFYHLEKWAQAMGDIQMHKTRVDDFDVFQGHEFLSYRYDRCGVTEICGGEAPSADQKRWVVFVDMHS